MASGTQDTSLWLHNKLGTSNDSWIGGSIVSQLNPEILVKIQRCFQDLQPQVKLKLLLSFFHIPRRNLEQWKPELENIIAVATDDSEPWVCMVAELMKTFPETGQLNSDVSIPETNRKIFSDLLTDLKKSLKKSSERRDIVLPLECHYLNKNAFLSVVGHQPQTTKHFSLRRKPKAAALRAELLNKSQDAINKLKLNVSGAFPIRKNTMPRKMSDVTPLKGLPTRALGQAGFRNSRVPMPSRNPNKKEGGVKLLDIADQPIGYAAAKKRKKQQEAEDSKKVSGDKSDSKESSVKTEEGNPESTANPTPDYAAGLNPATPAPAPPPAYAPPTPTPIQAPPTPVYAPPTPALPAVSTVVQTTQQTTTFSQLPGPPSNLNPLPQTLSSSAIQMSLLQQTPLARTTTTMFPPSLQTLEPVPPSSLPSGINVPSLLARVTPVQQQQQPQLIQSTQTRIVQLPTQPIPPNRMPQIQTRAPPPPVALLTSSPISLQQPQITRLIRPQQQQQQQPQIMTQPRAAVTLATQQQILAAQQQQQQQQVQQQQQQQAQQQQQPRRSLTLTREQMLEAQEMFRTANKVTRPEKALILGFMAGSRDNPCPHLGNVVTIKLSENHDTVMQNDGTYATMIVETHFQMNYSTGEWKRIKKYRRLEEDAMIGRR